MQPGKLMKTSAQKRHTRSINSPWARSGAKKAARIVQWRISQYPIQFVLFEQFLKEHNLTYVSLHAYLAKHFDREAHIDAQEDSWSECEVASTVTEWEEVEVEEVGSIPKAAPPRTEPHPVPLLLPAIQSKRSLKRWIQWLAFFMPTKLLLPCTQHRRSLRRGNVLPI